MRARVIRRSGPAFFLSFPFPFYSEDKEGRRVFFSFQRQGRAVPSPPFFFNESRLRIRPPPLPSFFLLRPIPGHRRRTIRVSFFFFPGFEFQMISVIHPLPPTLFFCGFPTFMRRLGERPENVSFFLFFFLFSKGRSRRIRDALHPPSSPSLFLFEEEVEAAGRPWLCRFRPSFSSASGLQRRLCCFPPPPPLSPPRDGRSRRCRYDVEPSFFLYFFFFREGKDGGVRQRRRFLPLLFSLFFFFLFLPEDGDEVMVTRMRIATTMLPTPLFFSFFFFFFFF